MSERSKPAAVSLARGGRKAEGAVVLLLDIGNTHSHVGLARGRRLLGTLDLATKGWFDGSLERRLVRWARGQSLVGAAFCSVVPQTNPRVTELVHRRWGLVPRQLTHVTVRGVGVDYPRPETIGQDRLANAIAARRLFGAPVLVLDFGTALTLDVVDRRGHYIGGAIAPGISAMTEYLHERTALLPRIRIRDVKTAVGRSTEEAMLVGAVHGYRGLIRQLVAEVRAEPGMRRAPVVATGGYAALMARGLAEISAVRPGLTLEGLRLFWELAGPGAETGAGV